MHRVTSFEVILRHEEQLRDAEQRRRAAAADRRPERRGPRFALPLGLRLAPAR